MGTLLSYEISKPTQEFDSKSPWGRGSVAGLLRNWKGWRNPETELCKGNTLQSPNIVNEINWDYARSGSDRTEFSFEIKIEESVRSSVYEITLAHASLYVRSRRQWRLSQGIKTVVVTERPRSRTNCPDDLILGDRKKKKKKAWWPKAEASPEERILALKLSGIIRLWAWHPAHKPLQSNRRNGTSAQDRCKGNDLGSLPDWCHRATTKTVTMAVHWTGTEIKEGVQNPSRSTRSWNTKNKNTIGKKSS